MSTPLTQTGPIDLPSGWAWAPVSNLGAPEQRALTDGPFGSNLKTEHYTDSGPRVIRLQNVGDGVFVDVSAHISFERFESLRNHDARPGDIVLASLGERLPRACLVPETLGPAIVKADCPRLRPHPSLNAAYLVIALNSQLVRSQAVSVVHGIGRTRLKLAELRKLLVPIPPRAEQDRIVELVTKRGEEVAAGESLTSRAIEQLPALRRATLLSAVTGTYEHRENAGQSGTELLEALLSKREARWKAEGMGRYRTPAEAVPRQDLKIPKCCGS